MKQRRLDWSLLLALFCVGPVANAQIPMYNIVDLGSLGASPSNAYSINNQGLIGGSSYLPNGRLHAFLYSNGQMQDLSVLTTLPPKPSDDFGEVFGINASGQAVVTTSYTTFVYDHGSVQVLPLRVATGINNAGQVVGQNNPYHAAFYNNGTVLDLGTLVSGSPLSRANGINNLGQIVGDSSIDANGSTNHAFLYQNGMMQDLGTLPGKTDSFAEAINDSGIIVGASGNYSALNDYVAVYWQNGQIHSLGTLGGKTSSASAINKYGVIVGNSDIPGYDLRPFVYQNGQMSDVFAGTGWTDGIAYDINDSGQIVGIGNSPGGYSHAFLATPIVSPALTISGVITLGGLASGASAQSVTIELRPTDGTMPMAQTVMVGTNGSYSVSGYLGKSYTVSFKGAKWLRKTLSNVNPDGGNAANINVTLPAGDANDDNVVDIEDFGILVNAYGSNFNVFGSGYDVRADFTCSGKVDLGSFGLLVNSYGLTGDL